MKDLEVHFNFSIQCLHLRKIFEFVLNFHVHFTVPAMSETEIGQIDETWMKNADQRFFITKALFLFNVLNNKMKEINSNIRKRLLNLIIILHFIFIFYFCIFDSKW